MSQDKPEENAFFNELAFRLRQEGIEHEPPNGNYLPILLDGYEMGIVTQDGVVLLRQEHPDKAAAREVYHRVLAVAEEVYEYMTLMRHVPPLKAESLDSPYKLLADFNGYVLGGMASPNGVQFTTWQWTYERTGLTLGHYWNNRYDAAKQDFALRSGLMDEHRLFTDVQLTEIYRCAEFTLGADYDLTYEQARIIEGIRKQIIQLVPAVTEQSQSDQEQKTQAPLEPSM